MPRLRDINHDDGTPTRHLAARMSEDRPTCGGFRETSLADHSLREIASEFADALQDLTGQIYEVEITAEKPGTLQTFGCACGAFLTARFPTPRRNASRR